MGNPSIYRVSYSEAIGTRDSPASHHRPPMGRRRSTHRGVTSVGTEGRRALLSVSVKAESVVSRMAEANKPAIFAGVLVLVLLLSWYSSRSVPSASPRPAEVVGGGYRRILPLSESAAVRPADGSRNKVPNQSLPPTGTAMTNSTSSDLWLRQSVPRQLGPVLSRLGHTQHLGTTSSSRPGSWRRRWMTCVGSLMRREIS